MSVHGNAGEVVPDDLVNCREKKKGILHIIVGSTVQIRRSEGCQFKTLKDTLTQ